jgi:hypothetical protein
MPPFLAIFGLLIPAVQICCALHAYNRGKDRFWFFVILIFPVLGSAVYFFTEVVPELRRSGQLQHWVEKIPWLFGREINDAIRWEAIALDGLDRFEEAEPRYLHVIDHWWSEEMRFRLALMLVRQSRSTESPRPI